MFFKITVLLLALYYANCANFIKEKPDWLPSCRIYERGFTNCSTNSIQKLVSRVMSDKIPEVVEAYGKLNPLTLDKVIYNQDNNEAATIKANLTNLIIKGFDKMIIKESRVSKKDFSWKTKIYLPKLRLEGAYQMAGRVLLLPLSGNGHMFIDIDDMNILMHTKTKLYENGGFTFYNVTNVRVNIEIKGLKTYFDNLFNGASKEVEVSTNESFNQNWREFFEALRPVIAETVEQKLLEILSNTFHVIPANFLIEDIPTSEKLYEKANSD